MGKKKALSRKDKAMIKKMLVAATVYRLNRDPEIPMKQGMAVMRKYFKRINSWTQPLPFISETLFVLPT